MPLWYIILAFFFFYNCCSYYYYYRSYYLFFLGVSLIWWCDFWEARTATLRFYCFLILCSISSAVGEMKRKMDGGERGREVELLHRYSYGVLAFGIETERKVKQRRSWAAGFLSKIIKKYVLNELQSSSDAPLPLTHLNADFQQQKQCLTCHHFSYSLKCGGRADTFSIGVATFSALLKES